MQAQARICPICVDDHQPDRPCKASDLVERIKSLQLELAEAKTQASEAEVSLITAKRAFMRALEPDEREEALLWVLDALENDRLQHVLRVARNVTPSRTWADRQWELSEFDSLRRALNSISDRLGGAIAAYDKDKAAT